MKTRSTRKMGKLEELRSTLPRGWSVKTWSPGDGATRYRFFYRAPKHQTYSGPDDPRFTALGLREAEAFARGLRH